MGIPSVDSSAPSTRMSSTPQNQEALRRYYWEIKAEQERRKKLKERKPELTCSLREYVTEAWPFLNPNTPLIPGKHIDAMCEYLEAVTASQIRRLIINVPPRSGKSSLGAVLWPTWTWARDGGISKWFFWSYSASLSTRDSINRKNLIQSPWYQQRWGDLVKLADSPVRQDRFRSERRGEMMIMTGATGEGGDVGLVDDAHSEEEARSEAERRSGVLYVRQTLFSRLNNKETGKFVIIGQRLDEEDITGELLKDGGWEHLCLDAIEEERKVIFLPMSKREWVREPKPLPMNTLGIASADLLDPVRLSLKVLEQAKRDMGSFSFAGQMRQKPSPPEGGIIKKQWWKYYITPEDFRRIEGKMPVHLRESLDDGTLWLLPESWNDPLKNVWDFLAQSWDFSFKDHKDNDLVCGGVIGRLGSRTALLHIAWDHMDLVATCKAIKQMRNDWPQVGAIWYEDKANGPAVESTLKNEVSGLIPVEPMNSKEARLYAAAVDIEAGDVYLPHPQLCHVAFMLPLVADGVAIDWVKTSGPAGKSFIDECAGACVGGAHDDAADMIAQAINKLRTTGHGLFKAWEQQAANIKARTRTLSTQAPGTPEEMFKLQADAQMAQAAKENMQLGSFIVAKKPLTPLQQREQIQAAANKPTCPSCGNQNLSRVGELVRCAPCGWSNRQTV